MVSTTLKSSLLQRNSFANARICDTRLMAPDHLVQSLTAQGLGSSAPDGTPLASQLSHLSHSKPPQAHTFTFSHTMLLGKNISEHILR